MCTAKAPTDQTQFGQTMLGYEHTLYANFHQYSYLPIILFLIAGGIFLASLHAKNSSAAARMACSVVALLLVVTSIFIITF